MYKNVRGGYNMTFLIFAILVLIFVIGYSNVVIIINCIWLGLAGLLFVWGLFGMFGSIIESTPNEKCSKSELITEVFLISAGIGLVWLFFAV